jgi:hypothetical protein
MDIGAVLARRNDLSTFLVHLCRNKGNISARDRLRAILDGWQLNALSPFGSAVRPLEAAHVAIPASQRAVCFTETPLEHICLLLEEIDHRAVQFRPYGVAIPKKLGRSLDVNPVWYLDITPGRQWLTVPLNTLITQAIQHHAYNGNVIESLTPFIEQMGTNLNPPNPYRKEFWWEREWRHVGNFPLPQRVIVLCPENEMEDFAELITEKHGDDKTPIFLDPRWGLEQIIGRLAGFSAQQTDIL